MCLNRLSPSEGFSGRSVVEPASSDVPIASIFHERARDSFAGSEFEHHESHRLRTAVRPDRPIRRDVRCARGGRGWWESAAILRDSALALTTIPGDTREIAARLRAVAEELRTSQPWYRRSSIEVLLAAQLLRTGRTVSSMNVEVERAAALFRAHWRISGGISEVLSTLALADTARDGRVAEAQVARLASLYAGIQADHPYLTQESDWPLCALLTLVEGEPLTIARRVEDLYEGLRSEGFGRCDALQNAALALALVPRAPTLLVKQFRAVYDGFAAAGLRMGAEGYDEVAILCFAAADPAVVVATLLRHRERIAVLTPRPDRQTSFSLAAGTALLELMRDAPLAGLARHADATVRILGILAAQRAAVALMAAT